MRRVLSIWGVLALVVTCALGLRLTGLQFGLPAVYNPDEVAIMARALSFAKGTLNPENFLYPTFYFYVLFGWVGAYLGFIWLTGGVESLSALQLQFFTDPTGIYTAGRLLGVLSGTACIILLFRLTDRLVERRAALAAAAFLAVAPLAVRDSHYVKHDVFATLLVLLAYLAIVRIWPFGDAGRTSRRSLVLAGAACGMAFSTHYYCVFLALPLFLVIVLAARRHPVKTMTLARQLLWAFGAMGAAFLLLSPFLALNPIDAWRDIVANREIVMDRAIAAGAFAPAARYAEMLLTDSLGLPIVALGAIGVCWMLVRSPAQAVVLLAFPIAFFAFIANTYPASRYLNPILPFLALFAGYAIAALASAFGAPARAFWLATALCALPGFVQSVRTGLFFRQDDTRTLALRYIEREIPAGSTITVQPYSVPLTPSRPSLVEALTRNLGSPQAASIKFQLQLSIYPLPQPVYRLIFLGQGLDAEKIYVDYGELEGTLDALRRLDVDFVVVKRYNKADRAVQLFHAALAREGRRIAVFSPYAAADPGPGVEPFLHNTDTPIDDALERPGPPLEIWQLDDPGLTGS